MNTPYLMICLEMPGAEDDGKNNAAAKQWQNWRTFETQSKEFLSRLSKKGAGHMRPAANVLLLAIPTSMQAAIEFLSLSSVQLIPYKIYFLENEPKICA
jgi:hypothetical protein